MTGCSFCYLDEEDEERCVVCEAPYIRVFPYNRCTREDGTEKQRNCRMLFIDGTCLLCDYGYY